MLLGSLQRKHTLQGDARRALSGVSSAVPGRVSTLALIACSLALAGLAGGKEADFSHVPGAVIAHSPAKSKIYLGSPGIAVLPGGDYLVKCDLFGPGAPKSEGPVTRLFRSTDRGKTWSHVVDVSRLGWASVFVHHGAVYLLGTGGTGRQVVIRKSTDGGRTWTEPADENTGLLLVDGGYHCAPVPVVEHDGRLWRAMEDTKGPRGWGRSFRAFMMSVPAQADLLHASSWTCSSQLGRDRNWLDGEFGGWLEGNAVLAPDGQIVNILRVHYLPGGGKAAMIHVSPDGKTASFDPDKDIIEFPGGCKKFTIRHDQQSGRYWSLSNYIPEWDQGGNPERTRNTLALISSTDLRSWTVNSIVLYHPDMAKHGFQYVDWQFEGDDLIAAARTACDDGLGGAHNQHDANFITFHRVANFRRLSMADSVPIPDLQASRCETSDYVVTGYGFGVGRLDDNQKAFSNRDYVWEKVPESLRGWTCTQMAGGVTARVTVKAKRDCVVYAATGGGRSAYEMLKWQPSKELTFHYTDRGHTRMVVYTRTLKAGELAQVPQGNWTGTLVLMPSAD